MTERLLDHAVVDESSIFLTCNRFESTSPPLIMSSNLHLSAVPSIQFEIFYAKAVPQRKRRRRDSVLLLSSLLATGGLGAIARPTMAQNADVMNYNRDTGSVSVDNNAFDLQTGELGNGSNIPLPDGLPRQVSDRNAQPVFADRLAPNSIDLFADVDYVERSLEDALGRQSENASYKLQTESLTLTTQFNLKHRQNDHNYGEGIQVTVFGADGGVVSQQSAFVRGDVVRIGQNGEALPESARIDASYGPNERVELRVLNIRKDGAAPSESGIYFSQNGEFVVEDLQNGGDLDFNDGDYAQISGGSGEAIALEERENITYETQVVEVPLDPELRQEEVVETENYSEIQAFDEAPIEVRDYGQVDLPDTAVTRLGHASGVRTENDEQLVYSEYTNESQFRLGSDGLGVTGQLKPLVGNPNVPPTLLLGNITFDPTVGNNEAGLTGSLGVTQYLNPTHRAARDAFGNEIVNPEGGRLLESAGLLTNRRMVGYVPTTPDTRVRGEQVSSVAGIFKLPSDQAVTIAPPDPARVGRGNAAYTDNVGGLLIEDGAGTMSFVPQWTGDGYAQEAILLEPGEARRIVYALVPQQFGQALEIGQRYAVSEGADGYAIADGGFTIISADRQPQNFAQETAEVYAVEDTLADRSNAATAEFNGIQGVYAEQAGGERVPTVDMDSQTQADARVGNELFPLDTVVGSEGQRAYARTTRAGGFYLGGALTVGVGNQEDVISRSSATVERAMDAVRTTRTLNTFATPLTRVDEIETQTTEVAQRSGTAFFDINRSGELENARFVEGDSRPLFSNLVESDRTSKIVRGEEALIDSVTTESVEVMNMEVLERDETTTQRTDSYPNFSAVQGEVALGAVMNLGNTPWTTAANTVRAELFAQDVVVGRGGDGVDVGWRAEAAFHPFGERQRDAFQIDEAGEVAPVYRTEPVLDEAGNAVMAAIADESGSAAEVQVNRFVLDEAGDRVVETVGTGVAKGPGIYISIEDVTDDDEGVMVAGGLQFSF